MNACEVGLSARSAPSAYEWNVRLINIPLTGPPPPHSYFRCMRCTVFLLLFAVGLRLFAQSSADSARISNLLAILAERHFAPRTIDDRFSADVYDTYLRALDPDTLFIAPEERLALEKDRTRIDDQLKLGVPAFVRTCDSLMHAGLQRAMKMVDSNGQGTGATPLERRWEERMHARAQELETALNAAPTEPIHVQRAW